MISKKGQRERKRKRLPNELLQNALKKRKQFLCWAEQLATYHFCIKRKLVFFFLFGKFLKNIAKSAFKRLGEN